MASHSTYSVAICFFFTQPSMEDMPCINTYICSSYFKQQYTAPFSRNWHSPFIPSFINRLLNCLQFFTIKKQCHIHWTYIFMHLLNYFTKREHQKCLAICWVSNWFYNLLDPKCLASSVSRHVTLDVKVMHSSLTLGIGLTLKNKTKLN